MSSPIDKFDLRTIDINGTKVSAHCYRGLGAFRVDTFIPKAVLPFEVLELWSIMILQNKAMFPLVPIFKNIDEVAGAIWDFSTLLPWERSITWPMLRSITKPMSQILSHYKAFPFGPLMDKLIPESEHARLTIPIPDETIQ